MLNEHITYELDRLDPSCSGDKFIFDSLTELQDWSKDASDATPEEVVIAARKTLDDLETVIAHLREEAETVESIIELAMEAMEEVA